MTTILCGTEVPDSEFVNKVAEEAISVSRSGNEATITVKLVDVDADQKINVMEYLDRRNEPCVSAQMQEDLSALITAQIFPSVATWNPNGLEITTCIMKQSQCFLQIGIDDRFVLWSFVTEDFWNPLNNGVIVPMTYEEWREWQNDNARYCAVVIDGNVQTSQQSVGEFFSEPDFDPWEGPINTWTCVDNNPPPGAPVSCWRYYESNDYGDMTAYYAYRGEVCVPVEGGESCTKYYSATVEHDLYDLQEEAVEVVLCGETINLEGVRENKLYRKATTSSYPGDPAVDIDYCEAFERVKQEFVWESVLCLAPGEITDSLHPLYGDVVNPRAGMFISTEQQQDKYQDGNTNNPGGFITQKIKYASTFTPDFNTDLFESSGEVQFSYFGSLESEGNTGLAFAHEIFAIADENTKELLGCGQRIYAFKGGEQTVDPSEDLMFNHRITDGIRIPTQVLYSMFGYDYLEDIVFNPESGTVNNPFTIKIICAQGGERECAV